MKKFILFILSILSLMGIVFLIMNIIKDEPSQPTPPVIESLSEHSLGEVAKVDDNFIKNAIVNFGATVNDDGSINGETISLYYTDSWSIETADASDFFSWYMGYMWRDDVTYEQRVEKYKNPLGENMGWFFPADIYESAVMKYFDVTSDFLRNDEMFYNKEHNGYTIGVGGGKGAKTTISIDKWEWEKTNDIVSIYINFAEGNYQSRDMILNIRLIDDEYKYISYLPQ